MLRRSKKTALFERGAAAAAAVLHTRDLYVCPICGDPFDRSALRSNELTLEHVPPKSLGGKGIILTCRECNNTAGHTVDAALSDRAELRRFASAFFRHPESAGGGGRAVMHMGGQPVNVDIRQTGDVVTLRVLDDSNDPSALEGLRTFLKEQWSKGDGFGEAKITARPRYDERLARVGDLRCAFLACSAVFGYRFALSPVLASVRAQIRSPLDDHIPRWWLAITDSDDFDIGIAESEGVVFVRHKDHHVVLPWPPSGHDSYSRFMAALETQERVKATAKYLSWPTFFHAHIDLGTN